MRLRGRRHWTERVTVLSVTHVTSGPNTGETTTTVLHDNIRASVQPASNADVIRHGLDTNQPVYWVRFAESRPEKGDQIVWRDETYAVAEVSEGADIDTQLLARLGGAP